MPESRLCQTCNGSGTEYLDASNIDPMMNVAGWYPAKLEDGWRIDIYSRICRGCNGFGVLKAGHSLVPACPARNVKR